MVLGLVSTFLCWFFLWIRSIVLSNIGSPKSNRGMKYVLISFVQLVWRGDEMSLYSIKNRHKCHAAGYSVCVSSWCWTINKLSNILIKIWSVTTRRILRWQANSGKMLSNRCQSSIFVVRYYPSNSHSKKSICIFFENT